MLDLPAADRMGAAERLAWIAAILGGAAFGLAYLLRLFEVDANGVSLFVGKPPTLDFTNLWYGGRLALEGRVGELFDLSAYRSGLEQLFTSPLQPSEWSYPPSLLLVGAPLAFLPLYPAYALWTLGTLAALALVLRRAGVPPVGLLLLLVSPAVLTNIFFGHNGAATAALLIGGLLVAERRPWLAGLCFGLLTMKPHLGILVPLCLAATRNWRALGWSTAFAIFFAGLSGALFGPQVWAGFWETTQPLMSAVLEAPYGNGYQKNAATLFLTARWLGAGLAIAYLVQIGVTALCGFAAWKLWRSDLRIELKVAATALLTPLATPYAYSYDMVMIAAGALILAYRWRPHIALLPLWVLPLLVAPLNRSVGHVAPFVLVACLVALLAAHGRWRTRGGGYARAGIRRPGWPEDAQALKTQASQSSNAANAPGIARSSAAGSPTLSSMT